MRKVLLLACAALALLLAFDSPLAMEGAREGLALCGHVIIPSLYPFFVVAGLYTQLGASQRTRRRRLLWALFRQPPQALGAMLLGLLGGYPLGAKTAAQLCGGGQLTRGQAQRLQLFCVSAGPSYLIGALGAGMIGSRRAGIILFVSMTAASLILGLCTRFLYSESSENENAVAIPSQVTNEPTKSFDRLLLAAVSQGTASVLGVCAWVVLFSALCALLRRLPIGAWPAIPLLGAFLEVSSGAAAALRTGAALPVLCAALGWGGLCVHCQILGDIRATGLPLRLFWASRLLHGALAAAVCARLLYRFPLELPAAALACSPVPAARLWAVSAPAAAAMLIFCAFLILDLDLNRKIC